MSAVLSIAALMHKHDASTVITEADFLELGERFRKFLSSHGHITGEPDTVARLIVWAS
jgi:hypothetical protein